MTHDYDDETPPLHPVRAERIPSDSWVPAGIELLPPGWCNVRIWAYDRTLGRDLYVTEPCPGILHSESSVTEIVVQDADPDGELYSPEFGSPYDENPTVVGTLVANPPHKYEQFVDPTWQPAYIGGGYLGTCEQHKVRELLVARGFGLAMLRPEGWVSLDDDL